MQYEGLLLIAGGLFTAAGGVFDWDWFFTSRKAAFFVKTFGRNGARIFYGALGGVLVLLGALILFGKIRD